MYDDTLPEFEEPTPPLKVSLIVHGGASGIRNATLADILAQIEALPEEKREQVVASIVVDLDAGDSAALRELRAAIDDHLGWMCVDDEEAGDYVARIKQFAEAALDSVSRSSHEELRQVMLGERRRAEKAEAERDRANGKHTVHSVLRILEPWAEDARELLVLDMRERGWLRREQSRIDKAEATIERMRPVVEAAEKLADQRTAGGDFGCMRAGLHAIGDAVDEYRKGGE